jgi:hypothetical protein
MPQYKTLTKPGWQSFRTIVEHTEKLGVFDFTCLAPTVDLLLPLPTSAEPLIKMVVTDCLNIVLANSLPEPIDNLVAQDPRQPGSLTRIPAKTVSASPSGQQSFLNQILRPLGLPHFAQGE